MIFGFNRIQDTTPFLKGNRNAQTDHDWILRRWIRFAAGPASDARRPDAQGSVPPSDVGAADLAERPEQAKGGKSKVSADGNV